MVIFNHGRMQIHVTNNQAPADGPCPRAPFDLTTLAPLGVSAQLAARYAEGGWLVRLAHGVYAFPNDDFGCMAR